MSLVACLLVAAALEPAASVVSARGAVKRARDAVPVAASAAPAVLPGERFVLGRDGRLTLRLAEASFHAAATGEVVVESPARLRFDGVRARVESRGTGLHILWSALTIHAGAASLRLRREAGGLFMVEVVSGDGVTVIGPGGVRTVAAGTALRFGGSEGPRKLAPAPRLLLPAPHAPLTAFRFRWRPVKGAGGYRFEAAADPLFEDVVYAAETRQAVLESAAQSLPLGLLYWRVTALVGGIEGLPSEARVFRVAP